MCSKILPASLFGAVQAFAVSVGHAHYSVEHIINGGADTAVHAEHGSHLDTAGFIIVLMVIAAVFAIATSVRRTRSRKSIRQVQHVTRDKT